MVSYQAHLLFHKTSFSEFSQNSKILKELSSYKYREIGSNLNILFQTFKPKGTQNN